MPAAALQLIPKAGTTCMQSHNHAHAAQCQAQGNCLHDARLPTQPCAEMTPQGCAGHGSAPTKQAHRSRPHSSS